NSRRRTADRDSGLRDPLVSVYRVRADVSARRRGRISVPADGRGGGVRAHRLVYSFGPAGPHHGELPDARRARGSWGSGPCNGVWGGALAQPVEALSGRVRAALRGDSRTLSRAPGSRARTPETLHDRFSRLRAGIVRPRPLSRREFLS